MGTSARLYQNRKQVKLWNWKIVWLSHFLWSFWFLWSWPVLQLPVLPCIRSGHWKRNMESKGLLMKISPTIPCYWAKWRRKHSPLSRKQPLRIRKSWRKLLIWIRWIRIWPGKMLICWSGRVTICFTVVPRHRMNCSFPNFRNTAILLQTMTGGSISVPMYSPLSSRWILPLLTVSKEVRLLFSIPIPWFLS